MIFFSLRASLSGWEMVALRERQEAELEVAEMEMLSFSLGGRISADPGRCDFTAASSQVNVPFMQKQKILSSRVRIYLMKAVSILFMQ